MNKRQTEILNDLKNQFELMNARSVVKTSLIDIASITRDIDESKVIRREVELQNEILRKELYGEFTSKLKQVQLELNELGIYSELREDGSNLRIGSHRQSQFFFISKYDATDYYSLPDGSSYQKFTKLQIHIRHGVYFDTVDELVKTRDFIDRIKVLAR